MTSAIRAQSIISLWRLWKTKSLAEGGAIADTAAIEQ